jgi:Protein of unknown function (DUF3775)
MDLAPATAIQVIFLHREGPAAARELHAFIDALNVDEKAEMTALAWIGRGATALATAHDQASVPTSDYLMGMPHLSENLEAGLEAMGVDVTGEEEDLL